MIRFVEITPPNDAIFRQAKIVSYAVNEGDQVAAGDALFTIESAGKEHPLPSPNDGRVVEFIVSPGDAIHANSTLVLLEMEVEEAPAAPTPTANKPQTKTRTSKKTTKKQTKCSTKQQLLFDVLDDDEAKTIDSINPNTHTKRNNMTEITIPDLGGVDTVEVIDILVKVGDTISQDDSLITVESDKASMDIPASAAGTIDSILVKTGDSVAEGDVVIKLISDGATQPTEQEPKQQQADASTSPAPQADQSSAASSEVTISVPDLGGAEAVEVIDLLVKVGDSITVDQPLLTVESDKASMDIPAATAGVVKALNVAVGDQVNEGDDILVITASAATQTNDTPAVAEKTPVAEKPATQPTQSATTETPAPTTQDTPQPSGNYHASPSVRRFARELGVNLNDVTGTQRKNRISKDDIKAFVKGVITNKASTAPATSGAGIPEIPAQDFSKFGEIEVTPLNKIKRVTAAHLHRCWLNIPHVTHSDESNVSSLEEFRKTLNAEYAKAKQDIKLSPLAFVVKAVISALKAYPQFNSSLESGGENLIIKNYYHIGIAVETPNGLVVPVIRDADKLSLAEIAQQMGELAKKARDGKLTANDMSGGTFSISSLGGIGGTHFTPIVNAPEVAILGVSRTKIQPVWNGSEFTPEPILPISLSYDHRVIDGAEAARFTRHIAAVLEDLRRLAL